MSSGLTLSDLATSSRPGIEERCESIEWSLPQCRVQSLDKVEPKYNFHDRHCFRCRESTLVTVSVGKYCSCECMGYKSFNSIAGNDLGSSRGGGVYSASK